MLSVFRKNSMLAKVMYWCSTSTLSLRDFVLAVLTTLIVLNFCFGPREVTNKDISSLEVQQYQLTSNGAWCWFADPRAVYYNGFTFVGWVTNRGDIVIGGIDHSKESLLPEFVIREDLQIDDHANPSILILQDERVAIFYSAHNGHNMYYRVSTNPADITTWGPEQTLLTNVNGKKGFTYPNPMILDQGTKDVRFSLFWRGGSWKPTFSQVPQFHADLASQPESWKWTNAIELFVGKAARPYIKFSHEVNSHGDKVHMAFTDGHPRDVFNNAIYYACLLQSGNMVKADGSIIAKVSELPVEPENTDIVYNGKKGRAWIWDIAFDKADKSPVIVYARIPKDKDHKFHYARWSGQAWVSHDLANAGPWFPQTLPGHQEKEPHYSSGLTLDHNDPNRIVLSKLSPFSHQFEIETWYTEDQGQSWTKKVVTKMSKTLNVRPIIPRSWKSSKTLVLWMSGSYQYWTNYSTSLNYAYV